MKRLISYIIIGISDMSEGKDHLKGYTLFEKIENQKVRDAILEIMRNRAEQIRRYADGIVRILEQGGVKISVDSKFNWSEKGLDLYIHIEAVAVRNDRLADLEKRTLKFQKLKEIEEIDVRDLNAEDDI